MTGYYFRKCTKEQSSKRDHSNIGLPATPPTAEIQTKQSPPPQECTPSDTPVQTPLPQLLTVIEQAAYVLQVSTERADRAAIWSFRALEEMLPYLGNSDEADRLRVKYNQLRELYGQRE